MPAPAPTIALQCDHGLRRRAIVELLLREVFHGYLRPGQHLVTRALAERFGVSHTPIREALIALAGIGIVDLLPNRGAVVRRIAPGDVREICEVRRVLECEAVRGSCGQIDVEDLLGLQGELRALTDPGGPGCPGRFDEARSVDSRLHDAIADSCGNRYLAHELGRLTTLFRAFRDVAWEREESRNDSRRIAAESREHLAIVEALLAGDRAAASRAMARHILSGVEYWSRALAAAPADEPRTATRAVADEKKGAR